MGPGVEADAAASRTQPARRGDDCPGRGPSPFFGEPTMKLTRRIGLFACSLGWHRGPFGKEPRRAGARPGDPRWHGRYYCRRCGLVGRLDVHGVWDPEVTIEEAWSAAPPAPPARPPFHARRPAQRSRRGLPLTSLT
jgi:hypothetical protein